MKQGKSERCNPCNNSMFSVRCTCPVVQKAVHEVAVHEVAVLTCSSATARTEWR